MPIYGIKDELTSAIEEKESKSLVPLYDSDRVGEEIVSTLSGYRWSVTYFHRNNIETDLSLQFDPNLDPTIQNYIRIDDLLLIVDSPLPSSLPDDMEGEAVIDIDFIPIPNDVILSKLPDNRTAIFLVSSVTRFNYNNENLFKIGYRLFIIANDETNSTLAAIIGVTTNELIYNKDYRLTNTKPLYGKDEFQTRQLYIKYMQRLISHWSSLFINTTTNYYMSFVVDNETYFDKHLENFMLSVIGTTDLPKNANLINEEYNYVTILDYIVRDDMEIARLKTFVEYISAYSGNMNPYLHTIGYTGIQYLVNVSNVDDDTITSNDLTINSYYPKIDNKFYIFRDPVYKVLQGENLDVLLSSLTEFEILFLRMLLGLSLDKDKIIILYKEIYNLENEEAYYFIPIFIYVLKYYLLTYTVKYV